MKPFRPLIYLSLFVVLAACATTPNPTSPPSSNKDPNFELKASSTSINLTEVSSTDVALELITKNGFADLVDLALTGLPEGVSASFSDNPIQATSTLKLTANSEAKLGSNQLTLTGTSGDLGSTLNLTLNLLASSEKPLPEPDVGNSEPILEAIEDQTLIRNTLKANTLELALDIIDKEQAKVTVTVESSKQEVLANSTFECNLDDCLLSLTPNADTTTQIKVTVTIDDGASGFARQSFLLNVLPRFVLNTNDAGEGSLRRAIEEAEAGDVIGFEATTFAEPKTIKLTTALLINKDLSIEGNKLNPSLSGEQQTNVLHVQDAQALDLRLNQFSDAIKVSLSGLSIISGASETVAAGIFNEFAELELSDCSISNNHVVSKLDTIFIAGGLANNHGKVTINRCEIMENSITNNSGGGITNVPGGLMIIRNSTIARNKALSTNAQLTVGAGGIGNMGQLSIEENTVVKANEADFGGGIANSGELILNDSVIGGETREDGNKARRGAGIFNLAEGGAGTVTIKKTTLQNNRAVALGGAIYNGGGELTLEQSQIISNASEHGAGLYLSLGKTTTKASSIHKNGGSETGGIHNAAGELHILENTSLTANSSNNGAGLFNAEGAIASIQNSTIGDVDSSLGNQAEAGAGIYNEGTLELLENANVLGNKAAVGGGIYNQFGTTTLNPSSFIAENQAETGGGIFVAEGEVLGVKEGANGNVKNNQPEDVAPRSLSISLERATSAVAIELEITGPNNFREVITSSTTFTKLPVGTYTVKAPVKELPGTHAPIMLRPNLETQTIAVETVGNFELQVSYKGFSNLKITINKSDPVDADVTVTGPNGFNQTVTETTVLTGLELGTYTVTARDVIVDNLQGRQIFRATPTTQDSRVNLTDREAIIHYKRQADPPRSHYPSELWEIYYGHEV